MVRPLQQFDGLPVLKVGEGAHGGAVQLPGFRLCSRDSGKAGCSLLTTVRGRSPLLRRGRSLLRLGQQAGREADNANQPCDRWGA
jgi:hypothetical protein